MFDFTNLSENTPFVKKLAADLQKITSAVQAWVTVEKVKRESGVSVKPVKISFDEGQSLTFVIRQSGDVLRVLLNGKPLAIKGDLSPEYQPTFKAALAEIAEAVKGNQAAFNKKQQAAKVLPPVAKTDEQGRRAPQNTTQMLKQLTEDEAALDAVIAEKEAKRDMLAQQLATLEQGA